MSVISDKIAEVRSSFDAAVVREVAEDADHAAKIAELQALVDAGGATPADVAALAELKTIADGLNPTSPVVLPPEVVAEARRRSGGRR